MDDEGLRQNFQTPDALVVATPSDRPNLYLGVEKTAGEAARRTAILKVVREVEGTGIIYTATVRAVKELTQFLQDFGVAAESYHGQLRAAARTENHERFLSGDLKVIVATNAFGMGIEKPDIRFVIHHHVPATVEAYYQEVSRGGRDGAFARGILLYDPTDKSIHRFFQAGRYPTGEDLVNTHHALKRLATASTDPQTFERLRSISPVPKSRLKQALNLFKSRSVVKEEDGLYQLVVPELTMEELNRMAGDYRERDERDLLKQHQMVEYAEGRACRWATLADYLEGDIEIPRPEGLCGHCDNCQGLE